jgi:hypothetical protein
MHPRYALLNNASRRRDRTGVVEVTETDRAQRVFRAWTSELLDRLRTEGDPPADEVAEKFFADLSGDADPARFFRVSRGTRTDPVVAGWLAEDPQPPEWVDFDQVNRGAAFFTDHGLEIGLALFCSALPLGYACPPVANVLEFTARLESDVRHRILETAQMVLDVTTPHGLEPGGPAVRTVRQVRLMHAGVRWLVRHDPRVVRTESGGMDEEPSWDPRWPMPTSQEHLLGALMAFSIRSLMALDTMRIRYDRTAAESWMHLWSYIGYLIGIDPTILPIDVASGRDLDALLMQRDIQASPAGRRLTAAVIKLLDEIGPMRFLRGLPRAATYALLGAGLARELAVEPPGWERWLFAELTAELRLEALAALRDRLLGLAVRRITRSVLVGFVRLERHEGRPAFAIPDHLNDRWRLTPS